MHIGSGFDAGNVEVEKLSAGEEIRLQIRKDANSEFYQWFYFRLTGARDQNCRICLANVAGAAYPDGFRDYRILYSYDREHWRRHDTYLESGELRFEFTSKQDAVYFAYFVPYSMERHHDLLARSLQSPRCRLQNLGQTLDGRDLDLLTIRAPDAVKQRPVWLIGRQHPGETMAQWWMEGALQKLLDPEDACSRQILAQAQIYLVANMNPDGSHRGHLRTNAAGRNLNREWAAPSLEASPEVYLVKEAMAATGVDFFLDVHGDESLPHCFIAGTEGLSSWSESDQARLDFYKNRLAELNPDFQTRMGYPPKPRGQANLGMSTVQTAHNHDCLAMTLEMPFKDSADNPDPVHGWSPERSKKLAHSCLETLRDYLESGLV